MDHSHRRRSFLKNVLLFTILSGAGATRLPAANTSGAKILTGVDVLARDKFRLLHGKRVGLLTHPAGFNRFGTSTIDILKGSPLVNLVALFGPEHGIYGDEKANVPVANRIDPKTRLPVFSLYGKYRRPTTDMLARIDTMVVDLQDIGSRSYTYVSCLRYVMEEAFQQGKEVVVLDRPNPLGGLKVDGPPLNKEWMSYVGAFQVPYVHGMTIGELANMAKNQPGVLQIPDRDRRRGRLHVVPMSGWSRGMMWNSTGLKWIPTSPAIPDLSAALGYPMTGLGAKLGSFTHGYGTQLPFRLVQFTGKSPEVISAALSSRGIPGLAFPVVPFSAKGQPRRATYVQVIDWNRLRPTELSLHMMALACQWNPANPFAKATDSQKSLFNKHVGDGRVLNYLIQRGDAIPINSLLADWSAYCRNFRRESTRFHLYRA
jgi:uncharacterized protein YbbC (DUF1343 family)